MGLGEWREPHLKASPGQGQACKAVVGTDHGFVWEYEWLGFDPAPKTGQGWGYNPLFSVQTRFLRGESVGPWVISWFLFCLKYVLGSHFFFLFPFIHPSIHPSIHLSFCLPSHPFIHSLILACVHLSTHPSTHLCICPSILPSFHSSICLFIHLNTQPSNHINSPTHSPFLPPFLPSIRP